MKKILILLLAVLMLAGCSADPQESGTDTVPSTGAPTDGGEQKVDYSQYENKITLMCYNIYYQNVDARAANIQDLIRKTDPDVLLLQEVSVSWIPYLQSFMAENSYSYYGYGRYGGEMGGDDLESGDQFVPILWKTEKFDLAESGHFWLSSTPEEVRSAAWVDGTVSKYPRCVNWVILRDKVTGGECMVMNIHTDPENDRVRTLSCDLAVRKLNEYRGDRPAVICGDFNMQMTDSGYAILTESGYPDVRIKAEQTEYGGSFNNWGARKDDNFAFGDHIFMSEDMAAREFQVVNDYYDGEHISDHNPLRAVLYY